MLVSVETSGVEAFASADMSWASCNVATICSMEGLCCLSAVHDRAN